MNRVLPAARWTALLVAVAMTARGAAAVAAPGTLHPPEIVLRQLDVLQRVDRVEDLPAGVRSGWHLAEPGAKWNATDTVSDATLPFSRLIFAACTGALCLVHYEHGGIAHTVNVVALARSGDRWTRIWRASGSQPARDLGELRALVRNQSNLRYDDRAGSTMSETPAKMIALASASSGVKRSWKSSIPRITATIGLTYAYVDASAVLAVCIV